MLIQLNKWGNSLGLRIPKEYLGRLGIKEGSKLELEIENNYLVLRALDLDSLSRDIDLRSMVAKVNDINMYNTLNDKVEGEEEW